MRGFQTPHNASRINAGFSPGGKFPVNFTRNPEFFRSLFCPEEIWPYSRNLFRGSFKRVLQRIDHHAKAIHSARRAGQGIHHRKTVDRAGKTHGGYLDPGITELLA